MSIYIMKSDMSLIIRKDHYHHKNK